MALSKTVDPPGICHHCSLCLFNISLTNSAPVCHIYVLSLGSPSNTEGWHWEAIKYFQSSITGLQNRALNGLASTITIAEGFKSLSMHHL